MPTYSPVKSRKLKPDAIPTEFIEEAEAIVIENDLGMYIYFLIPFFLADL